MQDDTPAAGTAAYQSRVYGDGFYRRWTRLRWAFRYDCRYRILLTEELFRRHWIPFERMKVYELGFGTGYLLLRFDRTCAIHGCELSRDAIALLERSAEQRGFEDVRLVEAAQDGSARFPDSSYDLVIASHVLEHVPSDRQALEAMFDHTGPGGHGLFFLPLERPGHNPDHARTYTAAGLKRLLEDVGWEPVEIAENFRYASHLVQIVNWPSRRRIPVAGKLVEGVKSFVLGLAPAAWMSLVESPLEKLHVRPYQLMVLARKRTAGNAFDFESDMRKADG